MEQEVIRVAVDSCVIAALARLYAKDLSKQDKEVIKALKENNLMPSSYHNFKHCDLPDLLKDNYLGLIEYTEKGVPLYTNLINIFRLSQMVESGHVKIYITPTVFGELDFEWLKEERDYINNYVNIIQVEDRYAERFYERRDNLAREYVLAGAMKEEFNAVIRRKAPQSDAFIMAETSLCGLILKLPIKKISLIIAT